MEMTQHYLVIYLIAELCDDVDFRVSEADAYEVDQVLVVESGHDGRLGQERLRGRAVVLQLLDGHRPVLVLALQNLCIEMK